MSITRLPSLFLALALLLGGLTTFPATAQAQNDTDDPDTNLFAHLGQEHSQVMILFTRAQNAQGQSERDQIFQDLARAMLAHDAGKKAVVYPAMSRGGLGLVFAMGDHLAALALWELNHMPKDSARWLAKLSDLKDHVGNHVHHETSMGYPEAMATLGEPATEELERFKSEEESVMNRIDSIGLNRYLAETICSQSSEDMGACILQGSQDGQDGESGDGSDSGGGGSASTGSSRR